MALVFHTLLQLYEQGDAAGATAPNLPAGDPQAAPDDGPPDDRPIDAARLIDALGAHPVRDRIVGMQARAERAESPEALARDQARWIRRQENQRSVVSLRHTLAEQVQSFGVEETTKDVLRSLHEKLRTERVPHPR